MKDLGKRLLTALIGIPAAIFIMLHGGILFTLAIVIVSIVALYEFYLLAEEKGYKPLKIPMLSITAILQIFLYLFISESMLKFEVLFSFLVPAVAGIIVISIALWEEEIEAIRDISISITGFIYISLSLTALIGIREFGFFRMMSDIDWGYFIMIMFASVWVCDSAAYFIGSAIGKHKLFPRHSPKKSWEGAIAGFVFGTAAFAYGNYLFNPLMELSNTIFLGAVIASVCQLGDLAESAFKRDAGVKDSSDFFPGHGGFLDRFDGIIFISPVIFLLLLLMY